MNREQLEPLDMPSRFRTEVAFFMTPGDEPGAPQLGPGEYWVKLSDARRWLEEGVVVIVSPLDASTKAEIELSEAQETWLEWMVEHEVEHIRLEP